MKLPKTDWNCCQERRRSGACTGPRSAMPMNAAMSVRVAETVSIERSTTSKYTPGVTYSGIARLNQLHPLHADLDGFDSNVVAGGVKHWAFPLADPALYEAPAHHFLALLIQQDDGTVAAYPGIAVQYFLVPVPQGCVLSDPTLERDIGELAHAGEFARMQGLLGAFAIFHRIGGETQPAALAEARQRGVI